MVKSGIVLFSNWNNGVVMIAVFALVCLALVGLVVNMMMSGKPKGESDTIDASNDINKDNILENNN